MSETLPPTPLPPAPDQRIQDPSLAWDMAYAEKPHRELEQLAQKLKIGGVAAGAAEQADAASEEARLRFDQTQAERAEPAAENTLNPYERLTDGQLEAVKANIANSVVKGVISYDVQEFARAGVNLFAVQREFERRFPSTDLPPARGKVSEGFYQITVPDTSTVEGIAASLEDTEGAANIAFGLRNTVDKEFMEDGKFPSDEAILEASEVQKLLSEVAESLQASDTGEPLKNPYSGKSNEEIQKVAERFDENIPNLEAEGRADEAKKAKAMRAQVQEVIDRRNAIK